jgi:hypothetical protein
MLYRHKTAWPVEELRGSNHFLLHVHPNDFFEMESADAALDQNV